MFKSVDDRDFADVYNTYQSIYEKGAPIDTLAVYEDHIVFMGHDLSTGTIIPSACYLLPITVDA